MSLSDLQESYMAGLRQLTYSGQKRPVAAGLHEEQTMHRGQQGKEYAFYDTKEKLKQAFPFSNKLIAASLIFWVLFAFTLYEASGYAFIMFQVTRDEGDLDMECKDVFSQDSYKNLDRIFNYPKGETGPYLLRLGSDKPDTTDYPVDALKLPPLVTAAWSSQFYQLQGLVQHVQEDLNSEHSDLKFIVYDVGLYSREKEILKKYCRCEVRDIDYSIYPKHVSDTRNYAWRPLIIQALLEEFGAVVFVEPTTRFKSARSLSTVRARGVNNYMLWDRPTFLSVVAYTSKHTFQTLNESRCAFKEAGIIDSQILVFYKTNITWHIVMKPWLKCALNKECIAPTWSRFSGCLHFRHPRTTGCHWYDISALSIILNRGVQFTTIPNHPIPRVTYTSEEEVVLFPDQPWTNTQLILLICVPVLGSYLLLRNKLLKRAYIRHR